MKTQRPTDRRKILLVLPIFILPFLALAFYAMGGGKGTPLRPVRQAGINSSLPGATFGKQKPTGKMEIYGQGEKDSLRSEKAGLEQIAARLGFPGAEKEDPTKEIDLKLQQIHEQINQPAPIETKPRPSIRTAGDPQMKSEVDRLEQLMSTMQKPLEEDQEMKQLNGMLEKVLDIQHPERIRDAYLDKVNTVPERRFAAIPAQVAEKQTLIQGAVLKLILTDSIRIGDILLEKGQPLFGLCNLTNQRLLVDIKTIRMGNNIIPVDLSIYSLDGIKGIAAPDAVVGEAISGGADDAVRSLQLLSMDSSVGGQVAGAGIDAAKGLFSKKVRRIKMKIKAGFPVLLRDNQMRK